MTSRAKRDRKLKTLESWGFYGTPEWRLLRKRVLSRYGPRCMLCGKTSDRPCVDHVLPRSQFPALALDIRNLQVLCWACNKAKAARSLAAHIHASR